MQIKYVGGPLIVALSRVTDPRFNLWHRDEIKDVPDYDVACTDANGQPCMENAIAAVFTHGFSFVDAATGKNPAFTCEDCGEKADHTLFRTKDLDTVEYVNAARDPLCVSCFLVKNPEHLDYHRKQGMPAGLLQDIEAKIAAQVAAAPSPPPSRRTPAPPPEPVEAATEAQV